MSEVSAFLGLLIPSDPTRGLPSGGEIDIYGRVSPADLENLQDAVQTVSEKYFAYCGEHFVNTTQETFEEFLRVARSNLHMQLNVLADILLKAYYSDVRVRVALGLGSQPPFPTGTLMKQSDLTILEPVFLRGSMYRKFEERHGDC
jgi:hypothetical protein